MSVQAYVKQVLIILSLTLIFAYLFMALSVPAFGWDAMDFWLDRNFLIDDARILGHTQPSEFWLTYRERHPRLTSLLLESEALFFDGFVAKFSAIPAELVPRGILWVLISISGATLVALLARPDPTIWMIGFLSCLSLPLYENHALIYGYAEILVTLTLLAATYAVGYFFVPGRTRIRAAALLITSLFFLSQTRNTGWVYSAAVIFSAFSVGIIVSTYKCNRPWYLRCSSSVFCGSIALITMFFLLVYVGELDRYRVAINFGRFDLAVRNVIYAHHVNLSFSIFPLAFVLLAFSIPFSQFLRSDVYFLSFFTVSTVVFALLLMGQLVVDHAFEHAVPGGDTGNSRFSLPMVTCMVGALIRAVALITSISPKTTVRRI